MSIEPNSPRTIALFRVAILSKRTSEDTFNPVSEKYLAAEFNKNVPASAVIFELMKATITSCFFEDLDKIKAGRILAEVKSVNGNGTKTILPNSNIAFL